MPTRHAARHAVAHGAEVLAERAALGAQRGIEHGELEAGLRHPVPDEGLERSARPPPAASVCAVEQRRNRATGAATSHAPCVYSLEYSGAAPVTISPQPSPSAVSARTTMTSRTVSVPNDVVNGETSGMLQHPQLEALEGRRMPRAGRWACAQATPGRSAPAASGSVRQGARGSVDRRRTWCAARRGRPARGTSRTRRSRLIAGDEPVRCACAWSLPRSACSSGASSAGVRPAPADTCRQPNGVAPDSPGGGAQRRGRRPRQLVRSTGMSIAPKSSVCTTT